MEPGTNKTVTFTPNHNYFSCVDERFMRKLFKLWEKHGIYQVNECYRILKKMYRIYIKEAMIREIIE